MAAPEIPDKSYFKIGEVSGSWGKSRTSLLLGNEFRINPSKKTSLSTASTSARK